jgi:nucleotide-binding universal stress UspA family protein
MSSSSANLDEEAPFTFLVAVDESVTSEKAVGHALRLVCEARKDRVVLVHATQTPARMPDFTGVGEMERERKAEEEGEEESTPTPAFLLDFEARFIARGAAEVRVVVGEDVDARELVVEECARAHADLVVMGSRGLGGLARMLLGSVATQVVATASAPVLVVRGDDTAHEDEQQKQEEDGHIRRWLVAVDLSAESCHALRLAALLADPKYDRLVACCIAGPNSGSMSGSSGEAKKEAAAAEEEEEEEEEEKHTLGRQLSLLIERHGHGRKWERVVIDPVEKEEAGDVILRMAHTHKADVLVCGARGRTGLARALLGSTSDYLVRHAACPVLVSRQKSVRLE